MAADQVGQVGGSEPKVGDKVTVTYTMTATNIEVKPAAGPKKDAPKK